jgi:CO dehydrogenase/acetyl-CoA synthase beta subunit
MALFDSPVQQLQAFLSSKLAAGILREFPAHPDRFWPEQASLVLEEDAALELGHPSLGSLSFLVWTEAEFWQGDRVLLLGPDLTELKAKRAAWAEILLVRGRFEDEYDRYRELREAVYETRLAGLMTRVLPSRQTLWSRVTRQALEQGLSVGHLGAALIRSLKHRPSVSSVWAVFITESKEEIARLEAIGREAGDIAGALIKMNEEMTLDCESCEFGSTCEKVVELKQIREKLLAKRSR